MIERLKTKYFIFSLSLVLLLTINVFYSLNTTTTEQGEKTRTNLSSKEQLSSIINDDISQLNTRSNSMNPHDVSAKISGITAYQERGPIEILNDSAFGPTGYNFAGIGTYIDPYLIDGFNITDDTATLIEIRDTTAYFKINNTLLNGINGIDNGIYLNNVKNGLIVDNIIGNCSVGIFMDTNVNNNTLRNNLVYNNSAYGYYLWYVYNNTIINNKIYNNSNDGFYIRSSNDSIINENKIYNNNGQGILLIQDNYNNTISENTIYNNTDDGIRVQYGSGNNITDNTIYNNDDQAIRLYDTNSATISGNTLNSKSNEGVRITHSNNTVFSNNIIYNCTIDNGIYMAFNNNTLILNNTINNMVNWYGIYMAYNNNTDILSNTIHNNSNGLFITNNQNCTISGNTIYNNTLFGVSLLATAANVTVKWNDFLYNYFPGGSSQADDRGADNVFDYNYWNDWTSPDDSPEDGIVDDPYDIQNSVNPDNNPLVAPSQTPPTVTIESPLTQVYDSSSFNVTLSGNAVYYWYYIESIDSQNQSWTENVTRTLIDGTYVLHAYGNNTLNNIRHVSTTFTINTPQPVVLIVSPTNTTYTNGTITIEVSGDADHYWYYIEDVDSQNQSWTTITSRELSDGTYTIHVYGNDSVGNAVQQSVTFTIDIPKSDDPIPLVIGIASVTVVIGGGGTIYLRKRRK